MTMEYITSNKGGRKLTFENNIYIKQKVLSNGTVGGDFVQGDFVWGDFVLGGILSGGFCPGDFVRGVVLEPTYYSQNSKTKKITVENYSTFKGFDCEIINFQE